MKTKLKFYNRAYKEIKKGFLRVYFFLEIKLLRFLHFTFKAKIYKKKNKISLLCPTKNRSKKFERFSQSLIDKTQYLDRIELLICFDIVEDELEDYRKTLQNLSKKGILIKKFFVNLKTHALRNNFLVKNSTGDIIFPVNDDLILLSRNWDNIIDDEFSSIDPANPFCVWVNCDRKYKNLDYSAFPIINRVWYNKLNYIVPEYFKFWYLDWWICDVARRSKKYFLSNVSIHQFHADKFKNEIDSTHKLNSTKENLDHDYNMWLKTLNYRIQDSIKINSN